MVQTTKIDDNYIHGIGSIHSLRLRLQLPLRRAQGVS